MEQVNEHAPIIRGNDRQIVSYTRGVNLAILRRNDVENANAHGAFGGPALVA